MTTFRHDWTTADVEVLYTLPFTELLYQAQVTHRQHFAPDEVQLSTLLSIKTGACPEDCAYCPQSGHYNTGLEKERLLSLDVVLERAQQAKAKGATRFCMGAAWRNPPKKQFPQVLAMIKAVKAMGLETCVTLGMLDEDQARQLKDAGLDYYNHNLDTSPDYYKKIISTRDYADRHATLQQVRDAKINVCCGGIIGMGETQADRVQLLIELANMPHHPQSVPINQLIAMPGTPLADTPPFDELEFVRTIAVARIMMPGSMVRLSAGRETMSDAMQALCFMAGANSIFYGEQLLTAKNPEQDSDQALLERLGMRVQALEGV